MNSYNSRYKKRIQQGFFVVYIDEGEFKTGYIISMVSETNEVGLITILPIDRIRDKNRRKDQTLDLKQIVDVITPDVDGEDLKKDLAPAIKELVNSIAYDHVLDRRLAVFRDNSDYMHCYQQWRSLLSEEEF